jgi:signal transduction histidine kinase
MARRLTAVHLAAVRVPPLRVPPLLADAGFAVVVTVFVVASAIAERRNHEHIPTTGVVVLLGLAPALAARRRLPGAAMLMVIAVQLGLLATNTAPGANVPVELIVPYSAAVYAGFRVRAACAVGAAAAVVAAALPWWAPERIRLDLLAFVVGSAAAWLLGTVVRGRRERNVRLAEYAQRLERERDLRARQAVADERLRIARELHDVVAHNLSVVVVQAQALRPLTERDPQRARELASSIEETGREALEEMRRLLGLLRSSDEVLGAGGEVLGAGGEVLGAGGEVLRASDGPGPQAAGALGPQPGMDALESLLTQVRQAGLPVTLTTSGAPRRLPPDVELSAYRIVQEALTNVLKHAGPATAMVAVGYQDDGLSLQVSDDGRGAAAALGAGTLPGSGHGLVGMGERVALFGGALRTGPRAGGGFEVRAHIPVPAEST